jgi:hypothetical protein
MVSRKPSRPAAALRSFLREMSDSQEEMLGIAIDDVVEGCVWCKSWTGQGLQESREVRQKLLQDEDEEDTYTIHDDDADSGYAVGFCERVEEHGDAVRVNHAGVDWGPLEIKGDGSDC